ncbi:MAG: tetraacyldisaccharide 4'-kinase [Coxiellaceae bacterium]|nr:tetraacyldisaccharide 4'-kinase [Coxiellaceae bacterium]
MNQKLLDFLGCPLCKRHLLYDARQQELVCSVDKLAFPIRDGVPVMLEDEARCLLEGGV